MSVRGGLGIGSCVKQCMADVVTDNVAFSDVYCTHDRTALHPRP